MKSIFSKSSLLTLKSLSAAKTLYVFDFDGTLSKIVSTPSKATVTQETSKLLQQLAALTPVAIVSGRSVDDLKLRVKFQPHFIIGNHGLEGLDHAHFSLNKAKKICQLWKTEISRVSLGPGVLIEDKTYTLTIHFRHHPKKAQIRDQILNLIQRLSPQPHIIHGKAVVNILPPASPTKGVAVLELMRKTGAQFVFYIGDDDTDEDVFTLLNPEIVSVRVGMKKVSHARFFIKTRTQINDLLGLIIKYHLRKKS